VFRSGSRLLGTVHEFVRARFDANQQCRDWLKRGDVLNARLLSQLKRLPDAARRS